jgi:hypothetical protein
MPSGQSHIGTQGLLFGVQRRERLFRGDVCKAGEQKNTPAFFEEGAGAWEEGQGIRISHFEIPIQATEQYLKTVQ